MRVGDQRDAVAPEPGRQRAVERVDPELDARDQIVDVTDPEQVARALGREPVELGGRPRHDLVHLGLVLAERAADRDPVAAARRDGRGSTRRAGRARPRPGRSRRRAWSAGPCSACQRRQRSSQRCVRSIERGRVVAGDVERGALVEHQRDVRAERRLDRHRASRARGTARLPSTIGAKPARRPPRSPGSPRARMSTRAAAALDLVGDAAVAHREHLKAAGVGDDRLAPSA